MSNCSPNIVLVLTSRETEIVILTFPGRACTLPPSCTAEPGLLSCGARGQSPPYTGCVSLVARPSLNRRSLGVSMSRPDISVQQENAVSMFVTLTFLVTTLKK